MNLDRGISLYVIFARKQPGKKVKSWWKFHNLSSDRNGQFGHNHCFWHILTAITGGVEIAEFPDGGRSLGCGELHRVTPWQYTHPPFSRTNLTKLRREKHRQQGIARTRMTGGEGWGEVYKARTTTPARGGEIFTEPHPTSASSPIGTGRSGLD